MRYDSYWDGWKLSYKVDRKLYNEFLLVGSIFQWNCRFFVGIQYREGKVKEWHVD